MEGYGDDFGSNTLAWNRKEPSQGKERTVKEMTRMKRQHRKTKESNKTKTSLQKPITLARTEPTFLECIL